MSRVMYSSNRSRNRISQIEINELFCFVVFFTHMKRAKNNSRRSEMNALHSPENGIYQTKITMWSEMKISTVCTRNREGFYYCLELVKRDLFSLGTGNGQLFAI